MIWVSSLKEQKVNNYAQSKPPNPKTPSPGFGAATHSTSCVILLT